MITNFTITGADDSIKPTELIELSKKYPFVEWGILVSKKQMGGNRFPTMLWMKELYNIKQENPNIKLSCHLCGMYVRELSVGNDIAIQELSDIWNMFERIQINFHSIPTENKPEMIKLLLKYPEKEFIFQYDNVNTDILYSANDAGVKCSALFDLSGGLGLLPAFWPEPLDGIKCGYAGGLSPDNLENQIKLIEEKVKDLKIWIDIETHVRSWDDILFELDKVETCLKIVDKHIKNETN